MWMLTMSSCPSGTRPKDSIAGPGSLTHPDQVLIPEFVEIIGIVALVMRFNCDLLVLHISVFLNHLVLALILSQDLFIEQGVVELAVVYFL
jgi:hypothetical protein